MAKKDYSYLVILIALYLIFLAIFKGQVFTYRFSPTLIKRYLCSQDIPHEPPCKRLFLSDGEIHIASGYLYSKGVEPTAYNFQHPPFIKYLYGYAVLLFGNPYYVQIGLGFLFILLTYIMGIKMFENSEISLVACLLLLIDPLFLYHSSSALLDLGQGVFLLLYLISIIFYRKNILLQGLSLGLLLGSKFWGGSLFFIVLLTLYFLLKRQFIVKQYLYHLAIAAAIFSLIYIKSFISKEGQFNIVFFELKTFKYWLNHSVTSVFGASLFLFLTGYLKSWWGSKSIVRSDIWTPLWPISLFASSFVGLRLLLKKKMNLSLLIAVIPILYLTYLGVQAPFTRYFILILPFTYLLLARILISQIKSNFSFSNWRKGRDSNP